MRTKSWRTEQMGSEGWSVFMPNPKLPRFEIVIASNLSEEHARLRFCMRLRQSWRIPKVFTYERLREKQSAKRSPTVTP